MKSNVSIGLRAKPDKVIYTIVKDNIDDTADIVVVDELILPIALELPEQLKFIRNTFLDIILEFNVNKACIRIAESVAQNTSFNRTNIEAVLQELIASSKIEKYYIGRIASISSKLGFEREKFKEYVDNKENYSSVEQWDKFSCDERESILAALSALNL